MDKLYIEKIIRPQFDYLGKAPMIMGIRYVQIFGTGIKMGDFAVIFGGLLNGLPFLISHFVTSVIVLLIGVIITRQSIIVPMLKFSKLSTKVSEDGDFSSRLNLKGNDEIFVSAYGD